MSVAVGVAKFSKPQTFLLGPNLLHDALGIKCKRIRLGPFHSTFLRV
jgi:hypothetical protein